MSKFQDWARREHSSGRQLVTLALAGILVVLTIPFLIVVASSAIDRQLRLPKFTAGAVNPIVGLLLIVAGLALGLWSVYAELTIGMGTPVPIVPTKRLVVKAPFVYCRNPMTLGTFIAYTGLCVWLGSLPALAIFLMLAALLLLYLKLVEEKELEARFGPEYLEYKRNTPFILPRLRRRS